MNLKVSGAILPLGCMFLSTRVKTVWRVVATPLPYRKTSTIFFLLQLMYPMFVYISELCVCSHMTLMHVWFS